MIKFSSIYSPDYVERHLDELNNKLRGRKIITKLPYDMNGNPAESGVAISEVNNGTVKARGKKGNATYDQREIYLVEVTKEELILAEEEATRGIRNLESQKERFTMWRELLEASGEEMLNTNLLTMKKLTTFVMHPDTTRMTIKEVEKALRNILQTEEV